MSAYLKCGIPAHGFVRERCEGCGESRCLFVQATRLVPELYE